MTSASFEHAESEWSLEILAQPVRYLRLINNQSMTCRRGKRAARPSPLITRGLTTLARREYKTKNLSRYYCIFVLVCRFVGMQVT